MKKKIIFITIITITLVIIPAFLVKVKPIPKPISKKQMLTSIIKSSRC